MKLVYFTLRDAVANYPMLYFINEEREVRLEHMPQTTV